MKRFRKFVGILLLLALAGCGDSIQVASHRAVEGVTVDVHRFGTYSDMESLSVSVRLKRVDGSYNPRTRTAEVSTTGTLAGEIHFHYPSAPHHGTYKVTVTEDTIWKPGKVPKGYKPLKTTEIFKFTGGGKGFVDEGDEEVQAPE